MNSKNISYEIIAREIPSVIRNCSKCKRNTEFYCSEKFRVNANQKMVDVWLIYNCVCCESTWNYPIYSRVHVNKINSELHKKFMGNDKSTIWHYAFQISRLRNLCSDVNTEICYELRKEKELQSMMQNTTISIRSQYEFGLRLDKLLAEILGVSRTKIATFVQDGLLVLPPHVKPKSKVVDHLHIAIIGNWYADKLK
ncbi:DUF1062 domain-containing protein [Ornithinibacillus xuwenensis]|uniref:DUF1062 domain-containing protein n=1 Tax=Ornithinibacillus xuwenensis TaxID=3144668 RepID=A0ABU9XKB3_9BACI